MSVSRFLNWRLLLMFAVLGPLAGAAPILAGIALGPEPSESLYFVGVILGWAYLIGLVPAAATGVLLPLLVRQFTPDHRSAAWLQLAVAPLLGFVVTWLLFTIFAPFNAGWFAILGAFSALVCAAACRALGVEQTNSSTPTQTRSAA